MNHSNDVINNPPSPRDEKQRQNGRGRGCPRAQSGAGRLRPSVQSGATLQGLYSRARAGGWWSGAENRRRAGGQQCGTPVLQLFLSGYFPPGLFHSQKIILGGHWHIIKAQSQNFFCPVRYSQSFKKGHAQNSKSQRTQKPCQKPEIIFNFWLGF